MSGRVKFLGLLPFFTKGKNQEEGSNAINVEGRMKNWKGW